MSKLTPASAWIKDTFERGVSTETVTRWIETRVIPGVIIDGKAFVDADKAEVLLDTCPVIKPAAQQAPQGNSNVASIMQGAMTR